MPRLTCPHWAYSPDDSVMHQEQLLRAESTHQAGLGVRFSCLYRFFDGNWAALSKWDAAGSPLVVATDFPKEMSSVDARQAHVAAFGAEVRRLGLVDYQDVTAARIWPMSANAERELRSRMAVANAPGLQHFLHEGANAAAWGLSASMSQHTAADAPGSAWQARRHRLYEILREGYSAQKGVTDERIKAWAVLLDALGTGFPDAELDLLRVLQRSAHHPLTDQFAAGSQVVLALPEDEQDSLQARVDEGLTWFVSFQGAARTPLRFSLAQTVAQLLVAPAPSLLAYLSSQGARERLFELGK